MYCNSLILTGMSSTCVTVVDADDDVYRGEPKCWYGVPGIEANAFEQVILL